MFNSFVGAAHQRTLLREADINARIEAIYDTNCETLRVTNASASVPVDVNCSVVEAYEVCDNTTLTYLTFVSRVFENVSAVLSEEFAVREGTDKGATRLLAWCFRIQAFYFSNCIPITNVSAVASPPVYDNCTTVDADVICDRMALVLYDKSATVSRLLSLCFRYYVTPIYTSGISFPTYSTSEICDFVREGCTSLNSSLSLVFCKLPSHFSVLSSLQSKCATLSAFEGCETQQVVLLSVQSVLIAFSMCLYAYLTFLYGRLEGEGGENVVKAFYFRNAMQNEHLWLPIWKRQFGQVRREPPIDVAAVNRTDVLMAVFVTYDRFHLDLASVQNETTDYPTPFYVRFTSFRFVKVMYWYLFVLLFSIIVLVVVVAISECPETFTFFRSLTLFGLAFAYAVFFNMVYGDGCGGRCRNIVTTQTAMFESQLMQDKSMQYALLTGCENALLRDEQDVDFDAEMAAFCAAEQATLNAEQSSG